MIEQIQMLNSTAKEIMNSFVFQHNGKSVNVDEYGMSNFEFIMSDNESDYFSATVNLKKEINSYDDMATLILKAYKNKDRKDFVLVLKSEDKQLWDEYADYEKMIEIYGLLENIR